MLFFDNTSLSLCLFVGGKTPTARESPESKCESLSLIQVLRMHFRIVPDVKYSRDWLSGRNGHKGSKLKMGALLRSVFLLLAWLMKDFEALSYNFSTSAMLVFSH